MGDSVSVEKENSLGDQSLTPSETQSVSVTYTYTGESGGSIDTYTEGAGDCTLTQGGCRGLYRHLHRKGVWDCIDTYTGTVWILTQNGNR